MKSWLEQAIEKGLIGKTTTVNTGTVAAAASLHIPEELVSESTEEEWMSLVCSEAGLHGWEFYHTRDSRGSRAGFPDLVLWRDGDPYLVFVELKDRTRKQTRDQARTLRLLGSVNPEKVFAFLWRPKDWPDVQKFLARPVGYPLCRPEFRLDYADAHCIPPSVI